MASSLTEVLAVSDLSVSYGALTALRGVTLDVAQGEALALIGPNGAGKSTLARALSGLVPIEGGTVFLEGKDVTQWKAHQLFKAGITHIPETRGVFTQMTVADNLRVAVQGIVGREARKDATERLVEMFPILHQRRAQIAGTLSGGEQQMLSLARALANWPKVLIVDELGLGLGPKIIDALYERLSEARQLGLAVLLIEQYLERALLFADRAAVLKQGAVTWMGKAEDSETEVIVRRYMGVSRSRKPSATD